MIKNSTLFFCSIALLFTTLWGQQAFAQCNNDNVFYTDISTTFDGDIQVRSCAYGGEYLTATVCSGVTYVISTCGTTWDTQITLYSSTGGYLGYNDDGCGDEFGGSTITWTSAINGTIRILIDEYNCTSNSDCGIVTVEQFGSCGGSTGGCPDDNALYDVNATPTGVGNTVTISNLYAGEYLNVNVCQGASYTFSTCAASYDTQLTLYSSAGAFLAHNDDACGTQSTITWTSTFTGVVRILLDQYVSASNQCGSNSTNTPISITQNTACANTCTFTSVTATNAGCVGTDNLINFVANYTGSCSVTEIWVYTVAGGWESLVLSPSYTSGQTIPLYFANSNTAHSYYFVLSNGTESATYNLTTINCQDTGCPDNNTFYNINATPSQVGVPLVVNNVYAGEYLNVNVCQGASYTFSTCTATYDTQLTLYSNTGAYLGHNDDGCGTQSTITWTATYTGIVRVLLDQYTTANPCASNTTSTPVTITQNTACPSSCAFTSVSAVNMGCVGNDQLINFTVNYTGICTIIGVWSYTDANGWEFLQFTNPYLSGQTIGLLLAEDNAEYIFNFVLSSEIESNDYILTTTQCPAAGCSISSVTLDNAGCEGEANLVYFFVNYTGTCDVASFWSNAGAGWQELVLTGTYPSGTEIGILLNQSNTTYQFYFELTDGTLSSTYSYTTINCAAPTCNNLVIDYAGGDCQYLENTLYPTGTIYTVYNGDCTVMGLYISANDAPFEYLDLSAYGFESGAAIDLFFTNEGADYQVYYILSNQSTSPIVSFENGICSSGETICDCEGTQLPIEALAWLGDGSLDDGTYFWNQNPSLPVNFNCPLWGFDCSDEMPEGSFGYDPYGTCAGNIPPANGCIPENCYMVSLDVLTDCYPEEVSMAVFNSGGDLVIDIPAGTLTEDYTFYELQLCLPPGCYTYYIYDTADDGMSYFGCEADGQFGVYDYTNGEYFFQHNGDIYTSQYSQEFCVGPEVTCENLEMSIANEPCASVQGGALTAHISFEFSFDGSCMVQEMHLSASGGNFETIDVMDNAWQNGDEGDLYNLLPNTSYIIYYTTTDGSTSPLYAFTTGSCSNEVTICDCAGNQHSIGVTQWLGDGFGDNGFYEWVGQPVNFNCATWGYDCGDIVGAPSTDPYNVCDGQLPPFNGCSNTNEVLGCTDQSALNYNPLATINDGSCIYNAQVGCTEEDACNYNPTATVDNGSCEYTSCAGCTDEDANNYDPTATIDDGSCDYTVIAGCTNPDALNYNPLATVNDGSCVFTCLWPTVAYDSYCAQGDLNNFYIDIDLNALGNGAPYTITNSYNNQQQVMTLLGSVTMGPFPIGIQVVVQVTSNTLECSPLSSAPLTEDCSVPGVYGCTDPTALNYNALATINDGSCEYEIQVPGCTDPTAINYNPLANVDDGSCEYEISVGSIADASSIVLFPNPAKNQVAILNNGFDSAFQIIILDNMGREVAGYQTIIGHGNNYVMDISALAQGHYHVRLLSNGKVEHRSLIIQK